MGKIGTGGMFGIYVLVGDTVQHSSRIVGPSNTGKLEE